MYTCIYAYHQGVVYVWGVGKGEREKQDGDKGDGKGWHGDKVSISTRRENIEDDIRRGGWMMEGETQTRLRGC